MMLPRNLRHKPVSKRTRVILFASRLYMQSRKSYLFLSVHKKVVLFSIIVIVLILYQFYNHWESLTFSTSTPFASTTNEKLYPQNPIFQSDTIDEQRSKLGDYGSMTDLIIVAGHAIYSYPDYKQCLNENNWRLQEFQRKEHHLSAFLSQIELGMTLTEQNPRALLIFSGGATRTDVGPISEGQTYWKVAQNCEYAQFKTLFPVIEARVFTEDYAMDSFQNILFSICRFHEITGNYPTKVTAISWSYKQLRFENLHRKALHLNDNQFQFIGEDGVVNVTQNAWQWETLAIERFKHDMYGCLTNLKETRIIRNPYLRSLPYPEQCPQMATLFDICQTDIDLRGTKVSVPWM